MWSVLLSRLVTQIDGFDVALMNELGSRLGVGVEYISGGTALTAAFGTGSNLDGSAGCNTYSASYLVQGRSLAITPPTATSKIRGEPEGIIEQEATFLNTLASAGSYNLEAGQLFISDASGQSGGAGVRRA